MCGICGIINYKDSRIKTRQDLIQMRDIMTHRGPDDKGEYIDSLAGLGHRRLSIIDLAGGKQPISNENKTIWVILNGEIYNFKELGKNLVAKGHQIKSKSDTEILVHLYEQTKEEMVHYLNGMFAFAIWDSKKRKLLLCRDRMGIKPLYYILHNETLIFASEIKALLTYLPATPQLNEEILTEYFSFRFPAGENTFFTKIKNLLPGHLLTWEDGKITKKQYWDTNQEYNQKGNTKKYFQDTLDELLQSSISLRLISDVPVGTFNSGGVDSSLISSYVAKMSMSRLHTFSVGFNQSEYDEREFAHLVSEQYNTIHHDLIVDSEEYAALLPKIIWHHDEPLNHAHSVHIYKISKLAKEFVTVVLTGEGSDELFAGYPRYNLLQLSRLSSFPACELLINFIAKITNNRKMKKILQCMKYKNHESIVKNSEFVPLDYLCMLFRKQFFKEAFINRYNILGDATRSFDELSRLLYLEQKSYLVSLLNRQDKMSMAAGIESRVPFLDYRLVEFSYTVPSQLKLKYYENKHIIKSLAAKYLPKKIVYRKKSGFGVPISSWLRNPKSLKPYLSLCLEPNSITHTYFQSKMINKIIFEHEHNKANHGDFLWGLINFELWYRIFYKNEFL